MGGYFDSRLKYKTLSWSTFYIQKHINTQEFLPYFSGAVPPDFNPLRKGEVYRLEPEAPEAPSLGEYRRNPRHFRKCRARVSYGPVPGPTLKRSCAILERLVGRRTNTVQSQFRPESLLIKTELTNHDLQRRFCVPLSYGLVLHLSKTLSEL